MSDTQLIYVLLVVVVIQLASIGDRLKKIEGLLKK